MKRALLSGALLGLMAPADAEACATAPPGDRAVAVADESAVIVWDEATHTEHFVRRASFRSTAKDFGFLVPTPSKPDLSETTDSIFGILEDKIRPEVTHTHSTSFEPTALLLFFFAKRGATASAPMAASVRVLEEKRVAGYDAAVLEADDASALARWLSDHGYSQRPALAEWLAPYVAKRWKLTAFKVADTTANDQPTTLGTSAVLMSFQTDRPYFPYREPRDQREDVPPAVSGSRYWRTFFVGTQRVSATIGDGKTAFPGKTTWSGPFEGAFAPPIKVPSGAWLTAFEDNSSPRPGVDDLWFDPAPDQTPVKPPPIVIGVVKEIPIPVDLLAVGVIGAWLAVRAVRKRAAAARP